MSCWRDVVWMRGCQILSAATEVALRRTGAEQERVLRREAGRECEFARRLFFDLHLDDCAVIA